MSNEKFTQEPLEISDMSGVDAMDNFTVWIHIRKKKKIRTNKCRSFLPWRAKHGRPAERKESFFLF